MWPLSRADFPKQFLCLTGATSLFQNTVARLMACAGNKFSARPPLIVCNDEHRFMAQEQLREAAIKDSILLLEPTVRNTADDIVRFEDTYGRA